MCQRADPSARMIVMTCKGNRCQAAISTARKQIVKAGVEGVHALSALPRLFKDGRADAVLKEKRADGVAEHSRQQLDSRWPRLRSGCARGAARIIGIITTFSGRDWEDDDFDEGDKRQHQIGIGMRAQDIVQS